MTGARARLEGMDSRQAVDRGWYYVVEPDGGAHAPPEARIVAGDGRVLTRRAHGWPARIELVDESGADLPVATWLRAAGAVGRVLERDGTPGHAVRVRLGAAGSEAAIEGDMLTLDGPWVGAQPVHHPVEALVAETLRGPAPVSRPGPFAPRATGGGALPARPVRRALFFESLMNSDMPHNDREISQGVLHMISPLRASGTEVVLANVKMSITGRERPVIGMEAVERALAAGPVGLVGITLLEGYWEGVVGLIAELRRLGCRAHIAVGGVMPTLTPEHVAAHLPDVSFVCRGAGEHFVPALARIVGDGDVDTPFTPAQVDALLQIDGLLAIDRPGKRLIGANPARTVQVEDLDGVSLDLSHLQARHIEGGIELSTSRGCVHKCTFCSIIGRESYQARSAEGIFELLERYEERFTELFGDHVPRNAHRVHISDDDFACDRERALAFFRHLRDTPFRLSSAQVSVADLCRREGGKLLAEPDHELLDAIVPACFADAGLPVPAGDYVADHRSRTWSSFLQIGVETYADAELVRLGKGYKLEHVRVIAAELDRRGLHFDGYFIVSNGDTTADDLIDVLEEVCRLKMRHPRHFHIRFPVVPRLVSYFPSASHRRRLRQGTADVMRLRGLAAVASHPELDYPFVEQDDPRDSWVAAAVEAGFFTDEKLYTGSIEKLAAVWRDRMGSVDGEERRRGERLLRRLDDLPRRLVFDALGDVRSRVRDGRATVAEEAGTRAAAVSILGPTDRWLKQLQRYTSEEIPRVVVIPTWQCELRCNYCWIPKQDGRVMTADTLERAIDLLLASDRPGLQLQYFGGEALLEYGLVQHGVTYGTERAKSLGKTLSFILSSNGWSLDADKLAWLAQYPVKLELSLDGDPDTQHKFRPSRTVGVDSYDNGIAPRAALIEASGLLYDVIMVVHPMYAHRLYDNFFHIAGLGFRRLQINFTLGRSWSAKQQQAFAENLHRIGLELRRRWASGERLTLVNLENRPMPMRLNGEVTVDWDGSVFGGNGFLHETEHKEKFKIGHLDDLVSFERYWMDGPSNEFLLEWSYPPEITSNNLKTGAILTSWLRWMYKQPIGPQPEASAPAP